VSPEADVVYWARSAEGFLETFDRVQGDPDLELVAVFFDNDLGGGLEGRHAFTRPMRRSFSRRRISAWSFRSSISSRANG